MKTQTNNSVALSYPRILQRLSWKRFSSETLNIILNLLLVSLSLSLTGQGLEVSQGISNLNDQTGGYAWFGDPLGQYISIDDNDIQSRFFSNANSIAINRFGGSIDLLGSFNTTGHLTVDGNGIVYDNILNFVGIGTGLPKFKLDVNGRTHTRGLQLDGEAYFSSTPDDGIIRSIDGAGADLFLISNDAVVIELDNDNNESGNLSMYNGDNEVVFDVDESGHTKVGSAGNGNSLLTLNSDRPWTFKQFGTGANTGLQLTLTDGNNANKPFIINSTGNVGIGNDFNPDYKLEVKGTAGKPGGGSWSNSSDRRLKKDIRNFHEGLSLIKTINPIYFHYNGKDNLPTDQEYVGVIAQELKRSAPFMVSEYDGDDGESYLAVDPSAFDFILINAVKEMSAELDELKLELKGLKDVQNKCNK